MSTSQQLIQQTEHFGANNYLPLPIVISKAKGIWVEDPEGNRYLDMLSAYSAVNQGHCHPKIVQALKNQADKVTLTSRAFYNDQLGIWYEKICKLANKEMALPMNTGAEAVETAIKTARRWGYDVKGIAENQAEIIACVGNFHGRTMAAVSLSSDPDYKRGFGPMLGGIKLVPYGDLEALKAAITPNTAAFWLSQSKVNLAFLFHLKVSWNRLMNYAKRIMCCLLLMKFRQVLGVLASYLQQNGKALSQIFIF